MIDFVKLNDDTACELCSYYKAGSYLISDYSIGIKTMWRSVLNPSFAVSNGCLCVMSERNGKVYFDFPMPVLQDCNVQGALHELSEYCREKFIPLVLENVPKEHINDISACFDSFEVKHKRGLSDYVYSASKLAEMSGRGYSAQRNHIKKFKSSYPNAVFRAFGENDIPSVKVFLSRFGASASKTSGSALTELSLAEGMIERIGSSCFRCGGYVLDNEIISLCFSEKCGDMLIDHIEKALTEFEGIYPATVQAFLQMFGTDVKYFNREDDASDIGLRMSKLQYKPLKVIHKYTVHIKNELADLAEAPILFSERLSFSGVTEADLAPYNRLCLDDARNKYWGYDYKTDCPCPDEHYFYEDQRKDFENRMSLTLAIRLHNKLIGEVILHNFDCNGSSEIGIRILPEHSGYGYGREALRAVIRHALYVIGLDSVVAKCYKENTQSMNMLSAVMRKDYEDDTFVHFISSF